MYHKAPNCTTKYYTAPKGPNRTKKHQTALQQTAALLYTAPHYTQRQSLGTFSVIWKVKQTFFLEYKEISQQFFLNS